MYASHVHTSASVVVTGSIGSPDDDRALEIDMLGSVVSLTTPLVTHSDQAYPTMSPQTNVWYVRVYMCQVHTYTRAVVHALQVARSTETGKPRSNSTARLPPLSSVRQPPTTVNAPQLGNNRWSSHRQPQTRRSLDDCTVSRADSSSTAALARSLAADNRLSSCRQPPTAECRPTTDKQLGRELMVRIYTHMYTPQSLSVYAYVC